MIEISKQLDEYQVEYQVLQEEIQSVQPKVDAFNKLELDNRILNDQIKQLESQNKSLSTQLENSLINVQRLEKLRTSQQCTLNKLEMQMRGMDVAVSTLALFIENLIDTKDIDVPGDVRRILSQYSFVEKEEKSKNFMNLFKSNKVINPNKLMVKSLSTGGISLPNDTIMRTYSLNTTPVNDNNNQLNSPITIFSENDWNQTNVENGYRDVTLPLDKKANVPTKASPTLSIDSGIVTPLSPKESNHPLSNCGVSFTYNGTRELKNIRTLKNFPSKNLNTE